MSLTLVDGFGDALTHKVCVDGVAKFWREHTHADGGMRIVNAERKGPIFGVVQHCNVACGAVSPLSGDALVINAQRTLSHGARSEERRVGEEGGARRAAVRAKGGDRER